MAGWPRDKLGGMSSLAVEELGLPGLTGWMLMGVSSRLRCFIAWTLLDRNWSIELLFNLWHGSYFLNDFLYWLNNFHVLFLNDDAMWFEFINYSWINLISDPISIHKKTLLKLRFIFKKKREKPIRKVRSQEVLFWRKRFSTQYV